MINRQELHCGRPVLKERTNGLYLVSVLEEQLDERLGHFDEIQVTSFLCILCFFCYHFVIIKSGLLSTPLLNFHPWL